MRAHYMENYPGRAADAGFVLYGERFSDEVQRVRKGARLPASKYDQLGGSIGLTNREARMRAKLRKPGTALTSDKLKKTSKGHTDNA